MLILLSLALLTFPSPERAVAQQDNQNPPGAPKVDAASWVLVDRETGLPLAGKEPDKRLQANSII